MRVSRDRVTEIRKWVSSSPESLAALDRLVAHLVSCPSHMSAPLVTAFSKLFDPDGAISASTAADVYSYLTSRAPGASLQMPCGSLRLNLSALDAIAALHAAAAVGDSSTLRYLIISHHVHPTSRLHDGSTALHAAATAGQASAASLLIDAGAAVNAVDSSGLSPLAVAISVANAPLDGVSSSSTTATGVSSAAAVDNVATTPPCDPSAPAAPAGSGVVPPSLRPPPPSRRAISALVYVLLAAGADVSVPGVGGSLVVDVVPSWLVQPFMCAAPGGAGGGKGYGGEALAGGNGREGKE